MEIKKREIERERKEKTESDTRASSTYNNILLLLLAS